MMGNDRSGEAAVAAGALAGIAGIGDFLVGHHLWIVPIWFIAPIGAIVTAPMARIGMS